MKVRLTIRNDEGDTREAEMERATYREAADELLDTVPDGWKAIHLKVDR